MFSRNSNDRYALLDIEITDPLPKTHIPENVSGIAVLVRRKGRPIHFWMASLNRGHRITRWELARKISRKSGTRILKASIREELMPCVSIKHLPSLTVAICTRDRPAQLARCLKSLQTLNLSSFEDPVSLDILVVDNAPTTNATQRLASAAPHLRYVIEPRPGLDFARNRAIKEAQGELLAFIDDDVVVDSGWLAGLAAAWMEYPDAAGFTGQVLPYELATKAQVIFEKRGGFRRGFDTICFGRTLEGHPAYPMSAGIFGTGANMAFQTHILKRLNGFDEALDTGPPLPAAGDHDIFYRLIQNGYAIVYQPEFLVFHQHRRDLIALLRQYWSWGMGVMALADKWRQTEPASRSKLRYLIRTWFASRFSELFSSLLRKTQVPLYMLLAETAGGIFGLTGAYSRSMKRIERIRKQFPHARGFQGRPCSAGLEVDSAIHESPNRHPSTSFKHWDICHMNLRNGLPSLSSRDGFAGCLAVFWYDGIPLGHRWMPSRLLPMASAKLTEFALSAITPAVGSHLLPSAGASLPSPVNGDGFDVDLRTLTEMVQPLKALEEWYSLSPDRTDDLSVSVVVCTRDRPRQLERCLFSLQNLSSRPEEIWVVDNAPRSDETRSVVDRFPRVGYIREPRPGLDVARNTGICRSRGDVIAFADDDAVVHPDWLIRIQQEFSDPRIEAVTGLVLPAELETRAQFLFESYWGFGKGYEKRHFGPGFFQREKAWGVPAWQIGAGANMAFRRKVFAQVGLFDERLDVGAAGCSGDSEMWYRILAYGGICCYNPNVVVYHYHRRSMAALHHQLYYYMRGHVTALLIQFERHRHWANIRRILLSLPRYYAGLIYTGLLNNFSERESTLKAEVLGALSGIQYYLHKC